MFVNNAKGGVYNILREKMVIQYSQQEGTKRRVGRRQLRVWLFWWSDVHGRTVFFHDTVHLYLHSDSIFEIWKKALNANYFWRLTLTKTLIPTWTLTPTDDMILLPQVGPRFIFGQDHRTLGILIVFILLLKDPVDWQYKRCLMWTRILHYVLSSSSFPGKWGSCWWYWRREIKSTKQRSSCCR